MTRIAFFVSGSGTNMAQVLAAIDEGRIDGKAVVVISTNSAAYALTRAKEAGVDSYVLPLKQFGGACERDAAAVKILREYGVGLIVLAGYLGTVTDVILSEYKGRVINVHPSLLPKYGGSGYFGINVHREVLSHREPFTGATVHFVDEGMDTGAIILQKSIPVDPLDTPESLQARVLNSCEYIILPEAVRQICAGKVRLENGRAVFERD